MANLPEDVVSQVVTSTDWATVAKEIIHAPIEKFVIAVLIVLVIFFGWVLVKFIDAKFISRQVTKVVDASAGVQSSNSCTIEANKKMVDDMDRKLTAHAAAISKDRIETREEIAKLRRELNDTLDREITNFKIAIGKLAEGNRTTGEAINKYQGEVDLLKTNFDFILQNIRKKNLGGGS